MKIPVRLPRIWKRAERHLKEALAILGGDTFSFDFYHRSGGASCFPADIGHQMAFNFHRHESERIGHAPIDRVALFPAVWIPPPLPPCLPNRIFASLHHSLCERHPSHRGLLRKIYDAYGVGAEAYHAQFHIRPQAVSFDN